MGTFKTILRLQGYILLINQYLIINIKYNECIYQLQLQIYILS